MSRRVVTGLDEAGKSCFIADGAVLPLGDTVSIAWRTAGVPADNTVVLAPPDNTAPVPGLLFEMMHGGGTTFMLVRMAPGARADFHATDTIDYITMLSGRMVLETETGETTLEPGDLCVDRGILHAWRNDGAEEALYTVVTIPSHPVGAGRTV
jgi:quercetin dioxygenase-like cupin family protein